MDPFTELEGLYKFLLEVDSLEGTNAQRRLEQIKAMGDAASSVYKKKSTTGKFNAHKHKYTEAQIKQI